MARKKCLKSKNREKKRSVNEVVQLFESWGLDRDSTIYAYSVCWPTSHSSGRNWKHLCSNVATIYFYCQL